MKNQQTGKSRGFGFITYKDSCVVDRVLASGPHELDGRLVGANPSQAWIYTYSTIIIFIHYKLWIAVTILDLKWVAEENKKILLLIK